MKRRGVFVALVEIRQELGPKPSILEQSPGLDAVVVDADLLVGIANGDVDGEVVVERVVGRQVELRQRGICHVELHLAGTEYEPED